MHYQRYAYCSPARRHFRTSSEETETESVESDPLDNNGSIEAPLSGCEPVKQTQRVDGKDRANTGEVMLSFEQYRAEETQKTRKSPIITPAPSRTVLTRARSTPNPLIFQKGSQTPPSKSRTMHLRRPRRPKHRRTGSFRAAARAARHGRQGESPGDGYKTEEDSDGPTDPRSMFRSSNSAASVFSSITLGSEVESMDRTNPIDSPLDAPRLSIASLAGDQGARTHAELPDRSSEPVTPQSLDNAQQLSNQRDARGAHATLSPPKNSYDYHGDVPGQVDGISSGGRPSHSPSTSTVTSSDYVDQTVVRTPNLTQKRKENTLGSVRTADPPSTHSPTPLQIRIHQSESKAENAKINSAKVVTPSTSPLFNRTVPRTSLHRATSTPTQAELKYIVAEIQNELIPDLNSPQGARTPGLCHTPTGLRGETFAHGSGDEGDGHVLLSMQSIRPVILAGSDSEGSPLAGSTRTSVPPRIGQIVTDAKRSARAGSSDNGVDLMASFVSLQGSDDGHVLAGGLDDVEDSELKDAVAAIHKSLNP